jgi:hypothetical protein
MSRLRPQATIPEPYEDVKSLRTSVLATKERVETLSGTRGFPGDAAVTWDDLVSLKLIKATDVPRDLGTDRSQ